MDHVTKKRMILIYDPNSKQNDNPIYELSDFKIFWDFSLNERDLFTFEPRNT